MGALFGKLNTEVKGVEKVQDRVGGGGFHVPADIYEATIKMMYADKSANGANSINITYEVDGKELRETLWVTNREGEVATTSERDGKTRYMGGYIIANDICMIALDQELTEVEFEEKSIKVYDPGEGKEVNKPMPVAVDIIGKKVLLGLAHIKKFKQAKGDDGKYHDTDKVIEVNEISKVFIPDDKRTVVEVQNEVEEPAFYDTWLEANKGKERDFTKGKTGGSGNGRPQAGGQQQGGGQGEAPTGRRMFGKKK